ncbi:hypothetical protein EDB85DRAFT_500767 [Lactarius pseudohatsudake]|nr:hypothetical protein EDB85DRAFT_500767 [Lactarius pseudohatsudake]
MSSNRVSSTPSGALSSGWKTATRCASRPATLLMTYLQAMPEKLLCVLSSVCLFFCSPCVRYADATCRTQLTSRSRFGSATSTCMTGTHTSVQRIRSICLTPNSSVINHIFAKGYLSNKVRSAVSWKRASGKNITENVRIDDLLSSSEGVSEDKPLHLVIGKPLIVL